MVLLIPVKDDVMRNTTERMFVIAMINVEYIRTAVKITKSTVDRVSENVCVQVCICVCA